MIRLVTLLAIAFLAVGLAPVTTQEATPVADAEVDPTGRPVGLFIERAGVLHPVEPVAVVEGVMQNPSGSLVVAWYHQLAAVGEGDNVVMAGDSGTVGVRPGVFTRLRE